MGADEKINTEAIAIDKAKSFRDNDFSSLNSFSEENFVLSYVILIKLDSLIFNLYIKFNIVFSSM